MIFFFISLFLFVNLINLISMRRKKIANVFLMCQASFLFRFFFFETKLTQKTYFWFLWLISQNLPQKKNLKWNKFSHFECKSSSFIHLLSLTRNWIHFSSVTSLSSSTKLSIQRVFQSFFDFKLSSSSSSSCIKWYLNLKQANFSTLFSFCFVDLSMFFLQIDNGQNDDDDGWILKRMEIFSFENKVVIFFLFFEANIEINVQCMCVFDWFFC